MLADTATKSEAVRPRVAYEAPLQLICIYFNKLKWVKVKKRGVVVVGVV